MLTLFLPDSVPALPPGPSTPGRPPGYAPLPRGARLLAQRQMAASNLRQTPWESWLAETFGTGSRSPPAAWSLFDAPAGPAPAGAGMGWPSHGQVLTACPAHLQATLDHLVLHPPAMLGLPAADAQALAAAANRHFLDDGLQLQVLAPGHWMLWLAVPLDVDLASSHVATGRRLDQYMPAGPDARRLRALLNEMQMLWHEHPVNERRRDQDELPVNALWVEGSATPLSTCPFLTVFSDQPTTRGLALASGLRPEAVCSIAEAGIEAVAQAAMLGPTLLELDAQAARTGLERWLASPAVRRPIDLVLTGDLLWQQWRLDPIPWWQFWQRAGRR